MDTLKNIGYICLSIMGICVAVGIATSVGVFGFLLGAVTVGIGIIGLFAAGIKEWLTTPKDTDA